MPNHLFWTQVNRAFSVENEPEPGAKAFFYENESAVQIAVYQDPECEIEFSQPVIADGEGTFPPVYISAFGPFRVRMTDADEVTLPGYPRDDIVPLSADRNKAESVEFSPSAAVAASNVQDAIDLLAATSLDQSAQRRALTPWTTGGTGNAYTITPSPALTAYGEWQHFLVRLNRGNTGAVTLNANGLGPRPWLKLLPAGGYTALASGDLVRGTTIAVTYDGTNFVLASGGPIDLQDGTAADPAIGFVGAPGSGWYRTGGGAHGWSIDGTAKATLGTNFTILSGSILVTIGGPGTECNYSFVDHEGDGMHRFVSDSSVNLMLDALSRVKVIDGYVAIRPNGTDEIARVTTAGLCVGSTTTIDPTNNSSIGCSLSAIGAAKIRRDNAVPLEVARTTGGVLINFYRGVTNVASVTEDGSGTVTYGTFCGAHWSQGPDALPGTILASVDDLADWNEEFPSILPKVEIAEAGSRAVYGVWSHRDDGGDLIVAALGAYKIRMASGQTPQRGDLVMSGGGGLGVVQRGVTFRTTTVGKITSATVIETYPDGSFLVPCTLHCG